MPFFSFLLFAILTIISPLASHANPWVLEKGRSSHILSIAFSEHVWQYDEEGFLQPSSIPLITKSLQSYREYGWKNTLTIGDKIALHHIEAPDMVLPFTYEDIVSVHPEHSYRTHLQYTFFLRKKLWQNESTVFSLEPHFTFPALLLNRPVPCFDTRSAAWELQIAVGKSFTLESLPFVIISPRNPYAKHSHFIALSGALYDDVFKETFKGAVTLGLYRKHGWLSQMEGEIEVNARPGDAIGTTKKVTFRQSLVKTLSPRFAIQLTGTNSVEGVNSTMEQGMEIGLWYHF